MYKQRLKEYIEKDVIYQDYKKQKEFESSDFDNFCILHCEDIEEALFDLEQLRKENKELQEELQKADSITQSCIFNGKKESGLNFRQSLNLVKELRKENKELHSKIGKAIEYLVNPVEKIWEGHSIDEVVRILKGDVDD